MKQSLQLKMGQHLTMTPQLQQAIRLLQLSTLDLQAEIQEALESNPMLEMNDEQSSSDNDNTVDKSENADTATGDHLPDKHNEHEHSLHDSSLNTKKDNEPDSLYEKDNHNDDTVQEGDWNNDIPTDLAVDTSWDDVYQSSSAGPGPSKSEGDDSEFDDRRTAADSLQDHLVWQLNLTPMSDLDKHIAEAIIDAVGPTGMLDQSINEIFEGLQQQAGFSELELDEMYAVLHRVQQFDPPGVCSQDAKDCLFIQLNQLPEDTPCLAKAKELVRNYLELLGKP